MWNWPVQKYYKITDINRRTHNRFEWELGKWYQTHPLFSYGGVRPVRICTSDCFHAFTNPYLAVFCNYYTPQYFPFRLWEAEIEGEFDSRISKIGSVSMRLVKELPALTLPYEVATDIAEIERSRLMKYAPGTSSLGASSMSYWPDSLVIMSVLRALDRLIRSRDMRDASIARESLANITRMMEERYGPFYTGQSMSAL